MKGTLISVLGTLVGLLSSACSHHLPLAGKGPSAMANGIVHHVDYVAGTGTTGYIRCGYVAGSATPATNWKIDGGTARVVPATPGTAGAFVATTRAGHQVSFTVATGNTPPGSTSIDLQGNQKATVWIKY
jgi:hypothetical protein